MARGVLYGAGAALACSVCYAIITIVSGVQLAIASIAVGFLIGRAVRVGSGSGGRRLQILAVALTYLSITTSYTPLLIKDLREQADTKKAKSASQTPANPQAQAAEVSTKMVERPSFVALLAAIALLIGIAFISPFLGLAGGVGGIIGIAIIYFGLMQAWKQTAGSPHVLAGPFTLEQNPSAG
jgi:hypothetical protein